MTVPNIGDILVLSQKAWKIGRTFSACQKNAPVELQYVETEIGSLAKSLASLAETLHAESVRQLLQDADQEIKDGVGTILRFCQRTVDDLDSLIDQYQVIKKHRTVGGFAIERSWSDLVLASYRTMIWTPEGGNLADLKEMLQTHTNSIDELTEALQRLVLPNPCHTSTDHGAASLWLVWTAPSYQSQSESITCTTWLEASISSLTKYIVW